MPVYDYFCPNNNQTVEVWHRMNQEVKTWGELCQLAKYELGETPADAPVRRLLSAPRLAVPTSDSDYKNSGFSKYVKRDEGVYENVTASSREGRFVNREGQSIQA